MTGGFQSILFLPLEPVTIMIDSSIKHNHKLGFEKSAITDYCMVLQHPAALSMLGFQNPFKASTNLLPLFETLKNLSNAKM